MKRLIIDTSSVVWQSLLAGKDAEAYKVQVDGKDVWVNTADFGYENAVNHLVSAMNKLAIVPSEMIFVVEGLNSKARRKVILSQYKETRSKRPEEAYVEFNKLKDELTSTFHNLGALVTSQDGVEADDVIAYLAKNLSGERWILSNDGDLAQLVGDDVHMLRRNEIDQNPYGPFPHKYITVYKALVGDNSDNIPGAHGFGEKKFLTLYSNFGDEGLAAMADLIETEAIERLAEDVAEFKDLQKVIDAADVVKKSWECAKLHDEWVNTRIQKLKLSRPCEPVPVADERLRRWQSMGDAAAAYKLMAKEANVRLPFNGKRDETIFDVEIIGNERPVFLVCVHILSTGERFAFWHHKGQMKDMERLFLRNDLTFVSFNGNNFDAPLISAAIAGADPKTLKEMAQDIIVEEMRPWQLEKKYRYDSFDFDHIDLAEVSPGVKISLKTFAGRMGYPTMVDLPFEHDQDLTEDQYAELETYCHNDLGVTDWLLKALRTEVDLRKEMSEEHDIDLRSKSDAQVAEAVLKKACGITAKGSTSHPKSVRYTTPSFIKTDCKEINELIAKIEATEFEINPANGVVITPEFLKPELRLGFGTYQTGIGGLHSTHDKGLHVHTKEDLLVSDFDVASYYPNIMMKAGLIPRLEGGKGVTFIEEYRKIYDRRMAAKHGGDTKTANALKISLNGTFGKLGSIFSAFYSPDLMLAVTITGQLNLLCLIYEMEKAGGTVLSANTDGIMVMYAPGQRERLLGGIKANETQTGFEYEETPYVRVAMKDVNNYIAITTKGKIKGKGLYAAKGLMKNPTMQVCSNMASDFLKDGVHPREAIKRYTSMEDFVSIRNVKGGGIQYEHIEMADDWILEKDVGSALNEWRRPCWRDGKVTKRKSRPAPVEVGVGGKPFGRIARWYMTTEQIPAIYYVGSGNKVPKTEGARLCLTLPSSFPADLDFDWYINETVSMLKDMGVDIE